MSNHDSKLAMARALRSAFRAETLQEIPTSEEVSQMLVDNGENPDAVAQQYKDLIMAKIRAAKKERMLAFRQQNLSGASFSLRGIATTVKTSTHPAMDIMRSRLAALSTTPEFGKSGLAIAYRNGTMQSDSDLSSLYQDLVDLGVIKDDPEN